MRLRDVPGYLRDTLLRMFPHRTATGLVRIGNPGADAPVLLTGNFTLTVRRLKQALAGCDVWLLCANSRGINVWCASGGGHLTHHDVISVIRTSGIEALVARRDLILPQLCATGVEHRRVTAATGWRTRWGPARLEDLRAFLDRGRSVQASQRFMRFPLWERLEMATMWGAPLILVGGPVVACLWGAATLAASGAAVVAVVGGLFALLPWLRVTDRLRWVTFAVFALLGMAAGVAVLWILGPLGRAHVIVVVAASLVAAGVLAVDLAGTTPWYRSYINAFHNEAHIDLIEERCTGAADCVQVCPRDVLQMNGARHKVEIARANQCIECAACVVQCPEDALRFRYDDGRTVEAATIRRTRLNMLGRRSVPMRQPAGPAS